VKSKNAEKGGKEKCLGSSTRDGGSRSQRVFLGQTTVEQVGNSIDKKFHIIVVGGNIDKLLASC